MDPKNTQTFKLLRRERDKIKILLKRKGKRDDVESVWTRNVDKVKEAEIADVVRGRKKIMEGRSVAVHRAQGRKRLTHDKIQTSQTASCMRVSVRYQGNVFCAFSLWEVVGDEKIKHKGEMVGGYSTARAMATGNRRKKKREQKSQREKGD